MAKFNIIGYNNQIIGEVDAVDIVDAWNKASEQFDKILDVREEIQLGGRMFEINDLAIDRFLGEFEELCREHGLSLAHEDTHGAFIIEKFNEENISWVKVAIRRAKYQ